LNKLFFIFNEIFVFLLYRAPLERELSKSLILTEGFVDAFNILD